MCIPATASFVPLASDTVPAELDAEQVWVESGVHAIPNCHGKLARDDKTSATDPQRLRTYIKVFCEVLHAAADTLLSMADVDKDILMRCTCMDDGAHDVTDTIDC